MSKLVEKKNLSDEKINLDSKPSNLEDNNTVTFISQEGDKFIIKKKTAIMSGLVLSMINDDDDDDDDDEHEIPLANVKSKILELVIKYMKYHTEHGLPEEIEKPLKSADMSEILCEWDAKFIEVDQEVLFELILAANYMDIKSLLDCTCATVASMIKGKSPEEIRQTFNIVNDFTPEEEEQVREENKWAEEV